MKLLPIYRKGVVVAHAKLDNEDYDHESKWRWVFNGSGYPVRSNGGHGLIYLHREVAKLAGFKPSQKVDHINRDKLDAQRSNLRPATHSEDKANRGLDKRSTTGFKGVYLQKVNGMYYANIQIQRKRTHLGTFKTALEAAKARDAKMIELFGHYARTNKAMGLY